MFTQLVSDNFQRANENPLSDGGNWSAAVIGFDALQLLSHAATTTGGPNGEGEAFFTGINFPDDQYAEVVLGNIGDVDGLDIPGLIVRGQTNSIADYVEYYNVSNSDGVLQIYYSSANGLVENIVAQGNVTPLLQTGDTLRLAVLGTTLSLYVNGVLVISGTDSNIASGVPGFSVGGPVGEATVTSFAAGSVSYDLPVETLENAILQRESGGIDVVGFRTAVVGVINS